jgi:hypothetical protein
VPSKVFFPRYLYIRCSIAVAPLKAALLLRRFACNAQHQFNFSKKRKAGYGNAGLMESAENDRTVFRTTYKTLKIDEADFHISTATATS